MFDLIGKNTFCMFKLEFSFFKITNKNSKEKEYILEEYTYINAIKYSPELLFQMTDFSTSKLNKLVTQIEKGNYLDIENDYDTEKLLLALEEVATEL